LIYHLFGDAFCLIVGANRVDIFIDYRAASTDQLNGVSKIIAIIGVKINFVKKGDCL
jgi:hypothetical protein